VNRLRNPPAVGSGLLLGFSFVMNPPEGEFKAHFKRLSCFEVCQSAVVFIFGNVEFAFPHRAGGSAHVAPDFLGSAPYQAGFHT